MKVDKKWFVWGLIAIIVFGVYLGFFGSKDNFQKRFDSDFKVIKAEEALDESENTRNEKDTSTSHKIMVHIAGEVSAPGVYELEQGKRVIHAIEMAKPKPSADINLLNLARVLSDGEKIIVPNKNGISTSKNQSEMLEKNNKISLNHADKSKLMELPGIGNKRAEDIIDYRESNGGFKQIEELKKVSGIGEKTYEKLKDEVTL